jgi:D-beta-D-heptose 7-phosphate kinase/D-beta-D-heptose 1-phosphate adenosyltransferase
MEALIDRCLQRRPPVVLVVGDIMCDSHLLGKVRRVSPEAPVPVFESVEQRRTLGGAANVATNLRTLGCEVRLIGVMGIDPTGCHIRDRLRQQGIVDNMAIGRRDPPYNGNSPTDCQQVCFGIATDSMLLMCDR